MKTSSCRVSLLLLAMIAITPQVSYSNLKDIQIYQLMNDLEQEYLYCGKDRSKLSDLINEVSRFDEDKNSPLWLLRTHLDLGYSIAKADSILDVLEYVEEKLDHIYRNVDAQQAEELYATFYSVMHDIKNGMLDIDEQSITENQTRDCGGTDSDTIKVRQKLYVLRSAKFFKDVEFKDPVTFQDNATFEDEVTFEDDVAFDASVTIAGPLSVPSGIIGCDLTVGCNINMSNSTSALIGNIVKDGVLFMNNFGTENTFVGANAGNFAMTGTANNGFGFNALTSNAGGSSNSAFGVDALLLNTSGGGNTAIGFGTLSSNSAGIFNTALGAGALNGLTSGSGNIAIGATAGGALTTGSNNIYIANSGLAAENNTIRIGALGAQTATYMQGIFGAAVAIGGLPVEVDAVGKLGTIISSAEFKKNIQDMDLQSEKLRRLRPVKFEYKNDDSRTQQIGLIAEEVAQVFPELVVYDLEGKPYSVRYQVLPVLLLQELQKHQDSIDDLLVRVSQLEELVNAE